MTGRGPFDVAPLGVVALLLWCLPARAQVSTVVLQDGVSPTPGYAGTRDVSITLGSGAIPDPDVGHHGPSDRIDSIPGFEQVLVRFDVQSLAGSLVRTANLNAEITNGTGAGGTKPIRPLLTAFDPLTANWWNAAAGRPWEYPGARGSGDVQALEVGAFPGGLATGPVTVALDAGLVQAWIDDPGGNFGVKVAEAYGADALVFDSCDGATAARRLALVVTLDSPDGGQRVVTFRNGVAPTPGYSGCVDTGIAIGPGGGRPNANGAGLYVQRASEASTVLISFAMPAEVPADAIVEFARLQLYQGRSGTIVSAYEVLRPWSETAASWTATGLGPSWGDAGAGSTTDHGAQVLATIGSGTLGRQDFDFTDAGVAVVQRWVARQGPNQGVLFFDHRANTVAAKFGDREAPPGERPALVLGLRLPDGGRIGAGLDGGLADSGTGDGGTSPADGRTGAGPLHVGCGCSSGELVAVLPLGLAFLGARRRRQRR